MKKIISLVTAALLLLPCIAQASDLSQWAVPDYTAASQAGLISSDLAAENLQDNITRQEFCRLIMTLYDRLAQNPLPEVELVSPFVDTEDRDVIRAYNRGIVSGRTEDTFDPDGAITRQELSKMLVQALRAAEINVVILKSEADEILASFSDITDAAEWASVELAIAVKYGIVRGVDESTVAPLSNVTRQQAISLVQRSYAQFTEEPVVYPLPEFLDIYNEFVATEDINLEWTGIDTAVEYTVLVKDSQFAQIMRMTTEDTTAVIPVSGLANEAVYTVTVAAELEDGTEVFSLPVDFLYVGPTKPVIFSDYAMTTADQTPEEVAEKELRVFPEGLAFATQEEAELYMAEVEVPVWVLLEDGTKKASTRTLTVNTNLANDVVEIFTEIFNDPSQFPIKNVGGYTWRNTAFGNVSHHSYGTCIDINYEENYYCMPDGTPITGSYWKPGEDVYSIPEDSIVVTTFAKYGWLWGGNAWGENAKRDYMHFTYLGK